MNKQAFTLVELIVVITILAILATIGFVSFSGYLAGARDTNRIAQLKSMSDALELYRTKKDLPIPDGKVDVQASGTTIAYQGYIGENVLETIEYTEKGLDPKDKSYFSYYLTQNKKYFQLLSFLEEPSTDVVAQNNNLLTSLKAVDYSGRYPKVIGKKLGILTGVDNTPIQEITMVVASGYLDIQDVGTIVYKALISDDETISGSGITLSSTLPNGNCKRIKQIKGGSVDGVYTIDPVGDGVGFQVYCDMTSNGGGWTRVLFQNGLTAVDTTSVNLLSSGRSRSFSYDSFEEIPKINYRPTEVQVSIGVGTSNMKIALTTNNAVKDFFELGLIPRNITVVASSDFNITGKDLLKGGDFSGLINFYTAGAIFGEWAGPYDVDGSEWWVTNDSATLKFNYKTTNTAAESDFSSIFVR